MGWTQIAPTMAAAFLAALVECVEALTVVLAVGTVRGWRSAFAGTAAAGVVLLATVIVLGPALSRVPVQGMQLLVGLLLLLFGMRWLRKAILRAAGVLAPHDEEAVFRSEAANLRLAAVTARHGVDPIAAVTAFKAVLLEGVEVAFIVLALGAAPGLLSPAAAGAGAAALLVLLVGFAVHRPLEGCPSRCWGVGSGVARPEPVGSGC